MNMFPQTTLSDVYMSSNLSPLPVDLLTFAKRFKRLLELSNKSHDCQLPHKSYDCEPPYENTSCNSSLRVHDKLSPSYRELPPYHHLLPHHLPNSTVTLPPETTLSLPAGETLPQSTTTWQQQKVGAALNGADFRGALKHTYLGICNFVLN